MRLLKRNTQTVYYAAPTESVMQTDNNGLFTGEIVNSYGEINSIEATITNNGGFVSYAEYGITEDYTKRMLVDDVKCSIDKGYLLWVGVENPQVVAPNYRVLKKDPLINNVSYLLKEVALSE